MPSTNALGGSAGNQGDACAIVSVWGLELQGPQLANAAQHHWQHKAVQPSSLCIGMGIMNKHKVHCAFGLAQPSSL